jgi:hypothetical protein
MPMRFTSLALISAVVVAGSLAVYGLGRSPATTIALPAAPASPAMGGEAQLSDNGGSLPPNHPPIDTGSMNGALPPNHPPIDMGSMNGALPPNHPPIDTGSMNGGALPPNHPSIGGAVSPQGSLAPAEGDSPAIVWRAPDAWQKAANPNAMRLATYRVPGGVEVSVSRAGGSTEANIQRWIAQFEDLARDTRAEKIVHGLQVVTVDIAGTYVGGGMTMGGPAEPKHDWAMMGAIVESGDPPYFFKMTGPAAAVLAAHPAFDRFVESVAPRSASR